MIESDVFLVSTRYILIQNGRQRKRRFRIHCVFRSGTQRRGLSFSQKQGKKNNSSPRSGIELTIKSSRLEPVSHSSVAPRQPRYTFKTILDKIRNEI